jgi:hypothetical protein
MTLPKGAINSQFNIMKTPFLMFQSHRDDYVNMSHDSLKGVQSESILSQLFFSPQNVNILQRRIIREVFERTDGAYLIEKQDEKDLQVIMRSMYIQHARHIPYGIKEQISELNNIVIDDIVPNVVSGVNAYYGYLDRAFGPREVMDLPQNTSMSGMKTIPSVTRTFGKY